MDFNGNVESTKRFLQDEVKKNKHTIDNPFGNAASYRKFVEYLYACVVSGENIADAKDWWMGFMPNTTKRMKPKINSMLRWNL